MTGSGERCFSFRRTILQLPCSAETHSLCFNMPQFIMQPSCTTVKRSFAQSYLPKFSPTIHRSTNSQVKLPRCHTFIHSILPSYSFYVQLPDTRVLRVEYTADQSGFHPVVTYEGEAQFPSGGGGGVLSGSYGPPGK